MPRVDAEVTSDMLGGKALALLKLTHAGFNVPRFGVVLPEAFLPFADNFDISKLPLEDPKLTQTILKSLETQLLTCIQEHFPSPSTLFAVRSSALEEDSAHHSFAGQLDSFLNVTLQEIPQKILQVWQSGLSERVLTYRNERQLHGPPPIPAVIIQEMIPADFAGVAFSVDPIRGHRHHALVAAVPGLGEKLVSGESSAETWQIPHNAEPILQSVGELSSPHLPLLHVDMVKKVASLVRECAQHMGGPQDIEWAIHRDELYLLQSRPITTLGDLRDPEGSVQVWDNANIAESYPGVSSPLTFSFARGVYEEVYRQFCRILNVSEETIANHRTTFMRMLGFIRGRIYYNLNSWYQVLALLPGYELNREFMEQMMGVKQSFRPKIQPTPNSGFFGKLKSYLAVLRMLTGLILAWWRLPKTIKTFETRFQAALNSRDKEWTSMNLDSLVAHFRHLEAQLLTRWDAPLINDFFAMIFFGGLKKQSQKWFGDDAERLTASVVSGLGHIISAEPARLLKHIAELARPHPALVQAMKTGSVEEIHLLLQKHAACHQAYRDYLDQFGDRCLEELKLESDTLRDSPLPLFRSAGHLADRPPPPPSSSKDPISFSLEEANQKLKGSPIKKGFYRWLVRHTQTLLRNRENLRFERTRLFGEVRRLFVECGQHLCSGKFLETPRDVFYLTVEEIAGFVEGTAVTWNLKGLVELRKQEVLTLEKSPSPASRFQTFGAIPWGNAFQDESENQPIEPSSTDPNASLHRKGLACSPGKVRGRARVIFDPKNAQIAPGEILVAERTDPGWVMLFASASGVLVEHGSLLSHTAIVARELGLPGIVSIPSLMDWVQDGELLELDGHTGWVNKIKE